MINLSEQIELGLNTVIEGLDYEINLDYKVRNEEEYKNFIGYNIHASLKSGGTIKGKLSSVGDSFLEVSYNVKEGNKYVPTVKKVNFKNIKDSKVFEEDSALVEPDKMKQIIDSKISSFESAKKILNTWITSANAPSKTKIKNYLERLVNAGDKALKFLRDALAHEIDYDSLEVHKHHNAAKAKPIILSAIFDLDSSLIELRDKLEAGDLTLEEVDFRLGYPERFANGEFFNVKKCWTNPLKEGAVKICPYGTEGETIVLSDLEIILPAVPEDKSKILYYDLPKEEQYWRRPEIPDISLRGVDSFSDFIKDEFRKRIEGVWFMNNGVPTYITGHMYFALSYFQMMDDGDYMKYREAQRDMFYHLQACIVDPRCLGQLFGKSRRTGFTYCVLAILANWATSRKNAKFGMMSKTGLDSSEAFMKLAYGIRALPFWFKPIIQGKEDSTSGFTFSAPADNSKEAKKKKKGNMTDYLNTVVDWRSTANGSYDSIKLNGYLFDECFSPETKILTSEGFKEVYKIFIGDYVINSKGEEKKVIANVMGRTDMFEVIQPYGKNYKVTGDHKLYVNYGSSNRNSKNIFISPKEYFELPEHRRRYVRSIYSDRFEYSEKELPIPPYLLGLWLGDGVSKDASIIVNKEDDPEIVEYLNKYCDENGLTVSFYKNSAKCFTLGMRDKNSIGNNKSNNNPHRFKKLLKDIKVFGNKHIPEMYLKASVNQRLELLAGIIDSDGYKKGPNRFNIRMNREDLIKQIYTLCKELGLSTSNILKFESNFGTKVFSVDFTDYDAEIPCKVSRKIPIKTKKVNRRNKLEIRPIGTGDFVGLTLEGDKDEDKLLVLEDYTITKNCFKIEKPNDAITHLGMIAPTMMPNNGTPIGTMFAGSTMGPHKSGGEQGIELVKNSQVLDRDPVTGKTTTGLYFHFLPAHQNMEEFTDKFGKCHTETPETTTYNVFGQEIKMGSIEFLIATENQKKKQGDKAYNEQLRTYPRTVDHMMRDESGSCTFNASKIQDQLDHNEWKSEEDLYMVGNFDWVDKIDGDVAFFPNPQGRFKVAWLPSVADDTAHLANAVQKIGDKFYPMNTECVRFGCDPFSIKATNGEGSKGAIHGKTIMFPQGGAPSNEFVVEYVARPPDEDIFFEDVIKVIRYYGAPILVESNRIDLLRHMRNRGYRPFAMNRLDKDANKLNDNEKEYGGQTMSSKDILDSHQNKIGAWIEKYVGVSLNEEFRPVGEMGSMPFSETLRDWLRFDPTKRTKYDATISSGLAIMACDTEKYKGKKNERPKKMVTFVKKYNNRGSVGILNKTV